MEDNMFKVLVRSMVIGMMLFMSGQQCWGAAAPCQEDAQQDGEWSHPDYVAHSQFLHAHMADIDEVLFYDETVQHLLYNRSVDAPVGSGKTALMIAAKNKYYGVAKLLLQAGAQVNLKQQRTGNSALMYAVDNGDHPLIDLLLEDGADVNISNVSGLTPLMVAIKQVQVMETKMRDDLLASQTINQHVKSRIAIVNKLLKMQACVDAMDTVGDSPLMIALRVGKVEIVDALLRAGASTVLPDGKRALDIVLQEYGFNHPITIRLEKQRLIDSGICQVPSLQVLAAKVYVKAQEKNDKVDIAQQTVDDTVALADVPQAIREIVNRCRVADGLIKQYPSDIEGFCGAIHGNLPLDIIKLFLETNSTLAIEYIEIEDEQNEDQEIAQEKSFRPISVLYFAIECNRADVVQLLLDSGANANAIAQDGSSTLMHAISRGNPDIVRILLDKGAKDSIRFAINIDVSEDPQEQRLEQMDALELARRLGKPEIVAMIEQALE